VESTERERSEAVGKDSDRLATCVVSRAAEDAHLTLRYAGLAPGWFDTPI
jgi:hypothetical protein